MAHDIWTYGATAAPAARLDLTGYRVEATDGFAGTVDTYEPTAGRAHVVVDTAPWIPGRRVIVPAGVVTAVDPDGERLALACSKQQIEDAPQFEPGPDRDQDDDEPHRMGLIDYYLAFFR
ncbi:PRC-barrel domain containing protein [Streptomyces sp. TX20-6-3]|uniref:PRC-barrel domain containing protein n=1 Tax=Streptomyces sp. TX20-6-3 TaxID=3028705 RepID=UPI0029AB73E8|nr:PRC-barrel domain containing protein [Streptomyces sp. TX20-6-3]MDX2561946.1 PRC-barrel domain containing protein [Streptomyces sp. TX20-6-3]